jgi:hypothetical protein
MGHWRIATRPRRQGLSRDGASTVYKRLELPAGKHRIAVRMRDHGHQRFTYQRDATVDWCRPGAGD